MKKYIPSEKDKRREFESREVFKKKGLSSALAPTGYEAFRVSPQKTVKYGKEYRKVYGAVVEPDYRRPTNKKNVFGANVSWHPHGYVPASVKGGTRMLQPLSSYPVDKSEAQMKLMLKRRKRR